MPKKRPKTANFAKNRSKTRKEIPFGRESDSKHKNQKKIRRNIEKARKKLKTLKTL